MSVETMMRDLEAAPGEVELGRVTQPLTATLTSKIKVHAMCLYIKAQEFEFNGNIIILNQSFIFSSNPP